MNGTAICGFGIKKVHFRMIFLHKQLPDRAMVGLDSFWCEKSEAGVDNVAGYVTKDKFEARKMQFRSDFLHKRC